MRLLTPRTAIAALALSVPLVGASQAQAVQLVRDGSAIVLRGEPGEANHMAVSEDTFSSVTDLLHFSDRGDYTITADPSLGCEVRSSGFGAFADCPYTGITEVRLEGADGNDELDMNAIELQPGLHITLDGGVGDDSVEGPTNDYGVTLLGGEGTDEVLGSPGSDVLDGGPGNDRLDGRDGDDRIQGGDGDDQVAGGSRVDTDVIDGGPGRDRSINDWSDTNEVVRPPIKVTLDGKANDGRAGENDNVIGVEHIQVAVTASLVAGKDAVEFEVEKSFEGPGSKLVGSPQADRLAGYNDDDKIDGKGGRDVIFAAMGNDVIEARDGVKDVIDCSDGRDVARVDRIDVTQNCERVKVRR